MSSKRKSNKRTTESTAVDLSEPQRIFAAPCQECFTARMKLPGPGDASGKPPFWALHDFGLDTEYYECRGCQALCNKTTRRATSEMAAAIIHGDLDTAYRIHRAGLF